MESGKNPGDKDKRQGRISPQKSKGQPKDMPNLKISIPIEFLSERQKKLLCQKPQPKAKPSTSPEKKDDVFKVPWIPPLRKKETSPSKASSNIVSLSSTPVVPMALETNLDEPVTSETVKDASVDEPVTSETEKDASVDEPVTSETVKDASVDEPVISEMVKDTSLGESIAPETLKYENLDEPITPEKIKDVLLDEFVKSETVTDASLVEEARSETRDNL